MSEFDLEMERRIVESQRATVIKCLNDEMWDDAFVAMASLKYTIEYKYRRALREANG